MIFELNGVTATLQYPAQYPMTSNYEIVQARDRSASGITHVEDFEVTTNTMDFNFVNLPDTDYNTLLTWFLDVAVGMLNEFYLTDDLGVTRLMRFTTPTLNFVKDHFNLWQGSFSVEQVQ